MHVTVFKEGIDSAPNTIQKEPGFYCRTSGCPCSQVLNPTRKKGTGLMGRRQSSTCMGPSYSIVIHPWKKKNNGITQAV